VFFQWGWFNHSPEISLLLTSPTRTKTECLVVKPVFHGKTRLGWMSKVGKIWATKPPAHIHVNTKKLCTTWLHFCLHTLCELCLILEAYFSDVHWLWPDIWSQSHEFVALCRFLILIATSLSIICRFYSFQQIVFGQMVKTWGKNRQNCARVQTCLLQRMVMNCILGVHISILRIHWKWGEPWTIPQKNVTFDPGGTCEMWSNRDADGFRLESSGWAQFFLYQMLWLGAWMRIVGGSSWVHLHIHVAKILLGCQNAVFTCWKCINNIVTNGFKCHQP